jgi:hypothetical protein
MAKLNRDDKMRIQTLREQGMGAKAIKSAYPMKNWSISTLNKICRRIDATGSAVERKPGSGSQAVVVFRATKQFKKKVTRHAY